jgi:hypothetical protein
MTTNWEQAQAGERSFHCDEKGWPSDLEERRIFEDNQRAFYAGLIGIGNGTTRPISVTDIGCGPESLLLYHPAETMFAVDPLEFLESDEERYKSSGIIRRIVPAETYIGQQTEEVWMYNCLQHTIDPHKVLGVVTAHAQKVIRIFEWVHVPTDGLHLHKLNEGMIIDALRAGGFAPERETIGRVVESGQRKTNFYAAIWRRIE